LSYILDYYRISAVQEHWTSASFMSNPGDLICERRWAWHRYLD
jgi:hypothetical protein